MDGVMVFARGLYQDDGAAAATEYALLITFIAIVAAAGMSVLGASLSELFGFLGAPMAEGCSDAADDTGPPCFVYDLPGKKKGL